jgi:hypothetical protein
MPEPRVIRDYLAVLAARLPASIVEELADGLAETYQSYLRQGLAPGPAAESAAAEFGDPQVIVAEFARVNPARRGARRLLATGPVVGGCWAAVLISGRAWAWPVPLPARIGSGLVLVTVIGLLAAAALGSRYRAAARAGIAGCLGIAAIDVIAITGVMLASPSVIPVMIGAMAASTARIALSVQALRPILTR